MLSCRQTILFELIACDFQRSVCLCQRRHERFSSKLQRQPNTWFHRSGKLLTAIKIQHTLPACINFTFDFLRKSVCMFKICVFTSGAGRSLQLDQTWGSLLIGLYLLGDVKKLVKICMSWAQMNVYDLWMVEATAGSSSRCHRRGLDWGAAATSRWLHRRAAVSPITLPTIQNIRWKVGARIYTNLAVTNSHG